MVSSLCIHDDWMQPSIALEEAIFAACGMAAALQRLAPAPSGGVAKVCVVPDLGLCGKVTSFGVREARLSLATFDELESSQFLTYDSFGDLGQLTLREKRSMLVPLHAATLLAAWQADLHFLEALEAYRSS